MGRGHRARQWLRVTGIAAVIAGLLVPQLSQSAEAYNLNGCKYKTMPVSYRNSGVGDYSSVIQVAAGNWTSTPTNVWLVQGGANSILQLFEENDGQTGNDGYSTWTCIGGWMLGGSGWMNTYYTSNPNSGYAFYGRVAVETHEVGHLLGLSHNNPALCSIPIMYYSSARWFSCGLSTPQPDDINGVKHLYG
jgi:predicted Zn-dependent protease